MEQILLNNGIQMPIIGFGTYDVQGKNGIELVKEAIQVGYRLLDTAHMYGNEKEIGVAVREAGVDREKLFITTKLNQPFNSYDKAKKGVEQSLHNMQLEYIDLYLIHEPYEQGMEMYQALAEFYKKGLIRAIGISNYSRRKYDAFVKECGIIPAVNQMEFHVYYPQMELKEHMETLGTKTQAWAPLAGGNRNVGKEKTLIEIGKKYNKTAYQVALRFLIQNGIAIIPKSHNVSRIQSNFELFDFSLDADDMEQIKKLDQKETLYGWMKSWE